MRILCVAEKPSIAKSVAEILSGGQIQWRSTRNKYIKNYDFDYNFPLPNRWGHCQVVFTSVAGHLMGLDFNQQHRKWHQCAPLSLFDARVVTEVPKVRNYVPESQDLIRAQDKQDIAENLKRESRSAHVLYIWTDCDMEGEHIGSEVAAMATQSNPQIQIRRARFSHLERSHVIQAAARPVDLDRRQVDAVNARIELDLRIGAAFTRFQTLSIQSGVPAIAEEKRVVSYGFVVDRYRRKKNFVAEPFWYISFFHKRDNQEVSFRWKRDRLFDRLATLVIYERCLAQATAKVTSVSESTIKKWTPLPLTTVELQKQGSKVLGLSSSQIMTIAEKLYTKGFISYPRTETDQFDPAMDLRPIIEKQGSDNDWGELLGGQFRQPRKGKKNDKAHPPIHPVIHVTKGALSSADEHKVYEFITRRFLACCSEDAKGLQTRIEIDYAGEIFTTNGLVVKERNFLDVYPYEKWIGQILPEYRKDETIVPTKSLLEEGQTTPPGDLTEPELIALMDANGIGTDATIAEHIAKIIEREYVFAQQNRSGRGVRHFVPSSLGLALAEAYEGMQFDVGLTKPFLRKEMEIKMKSICDGTMNKSEMVMETIEQYRAVFVIANQEAQFLVETVRKYLR